MKCGGACWFAVTRIYPHVAVDGEPLEEMIVEGESADLEFKSSFRWSYQGNLIDKRLEDVILKSISALSNSDGGTLLIGVNDEGEILGLEHDYASLDGSKDEFELHLRNLVNKSLGVGGSPPAT
jgi:predicted HTH transcriptional regulator